MTGFSLGDSKKESSVALTPKLTPWRYVWISIGMQFINGIQISIYYMSMWPYLSQLDDTANVDFLGWVVAAASIGCSIANPLFGYWNQRNLAVTLPTITGFSISALGQLMYGLLPLLSSNQKWWMLVARTITGFGSGSMSVLRAYVATATVPEDKLSAISYSTAGWVLGVSFGPAIQAMFTPVGKGFYLGALHLDMYTMPAFFMLFITLLSCLGMWLFFREEMSTPMSTVMYDWKDSTSVLNNGILESASCVVSVLTNFLIGYSRIGKIDKRKQIAFGLFAFVLFHLLCYPWPGYPGPLHFIPNGTTSAEVGGCDPAYSWCSTSVAIPMPIYIFCFVILYGVSFPFVGSPSASLYSDILGPRAQGMMQGLYSFGGSVAQFVAPIVSTYLFQKSGYRWVMVMQLLGASSALCLLLIFRRRLVALKIITLPPKSPIFFTS